MEKNSKKLIQHMKKENCIQFPVRNTDILKLTGEFFS